MNGPAGQVLVLFGATGDLARKMLWPALYQLTERGRLTVPVVGVALTDLDTDRLRGHVAASVRAAPTRCLASAAGSHSQTPPDHRPPPMPTRPERPPGT